MSFVLNLALVISVLLNVVLIWYIRELIKRMWSVVSSKKPFLEEVDSYLSHLKNVYEMEMFYGDETLQGLIDHTRYISNILNQYKEVESFIEEEKDGETSEEEE
jgi:hypothetical protein